MEQRTLDNAEGQSPVGKPMEEQPGTGYWSMNWVTRFIYTRVSPPLG